MMNGVSEAHEMEEKMGILEELEDKALTARKNTPMGMEFLGWATTDGWLVKYPLTSNSARAVYGFVEIERAEDID